MEDFYTYAWLREDGTPFYIGKGRKNRAWVKHRNMSPPPKNRVLLLKQNLTDEQAIQHEIYMISVLGRKDLGTGILINLSDGGEGPSNPSPSTRAKMSAWQKGVPKSESLKRKVSQTVRALPRPRWFHKDGVNRFFRESPPEGWIPGRVGLKNSWDRGKRVWWNDGKLESWSEHPPGEGWERGRLKRKRV